MDTSNHDDVFNSTTSWRLAAGALTDSISFESSLTTTADHDSEDGIIPDGVDHVAKSPLLLLPSVPNGEPCEITLTFAQEHELRQIYVRSSARVYEVYYTKKRRYDQEYLCTVRCGLALRENDVLQIPLTDSAASPEKDTMGKRVNDNGNGRTNEDDWVEVKAADDSLLPLSQLVKQDFFEATAEINDAEPCISITLRLLSLQGKGCALVDEVYVFADPVDPSESQQEEVNGTGNSSTSSLMAMFMPALLQLSRGKDVKKERDRQVSDKTISTNPGTIGNANASDKIVNEIQQETKISKADHIEVSSPLLVDTPAKPVDVVTGVAGAGIKPTVSCNNVEFILYQLVNKVSRIETILTRFEDQMLKPISSIDARLQRVEKKLEQLGKKSFESELVFETKLPNPDSLGSDIDKTSETDELDGLTKDMDDLQLASYTNIVVPDSSSINNCDGCAVVLPKIKLDNILTKSGTESNSVAGNEMISPESEISIEEAGHSLGRASFEEKPKHSLSINDALASALAGLLSSHSFMGEKYSQALVVTAPEFASEDDLEIEEKPRTGVHPDKLKVAGEELENTLSASETPTSSQKEPEITPCIVDNSQEMIYGVFEKLDDSFGGDDDAEAVVSVRDDALYEVTDTSRTKADCYTERESLSDDPANPDSLIHELEYPNATTAKDERGKPGMDDVLKSVLGFQRTTSPVDFQTPVLDVKFNLENKVSDSLSFLRALFKAEDCNNETYEAIIAAEYKAATDCNNESFDDNLVSVEDEEVQGPPTDTLSSLEMDHYETNEMPQHLNAEIAAASLI